MTSNLANCLVVNPNLIYYPDPGNADFSNQIVWAVRNATLNATVIAIDVWVNYHCAMGEIHCGTATRRALQVTPPWWEHETIKTNWRNEQ